MNPAETVHASAALIGEAGVLIRGPSGSGKSSLVLALLGADPVSTRLVADDRVRVAPHHGRLVATVPKSISGKIEIRGQGVVPRPHVSPVVIRLVVDLLPAAECPRMPSPMEQRATIAGVGLPCLMLPIGASDAAARVRIAVESLQAEKVE
jgi:HPr kinase/phosphorylase